jgi:hypothetical protein
MTIVTSIFTARNIAPDKTSMQIQFTADIGGTRSKFDPFVSNHLEWWEAHLYAGKAVTFRGWENGNGCYLVSEIISVGDE